VLLILSQHIDDRRSLHAMACSFFIRRRRQCARAFKGTASKEAKRPHRASARRQATKGHVRTGFGFDKSCCTRCVQPRLGSFLARAASDFC